MNTKLQKEILELINQKESEYILGEDSIVEGIHKLYFFKNTNKIQIKPPYDNEVRKQINFLLDDESIIETEYKNYYRLTKWGELRIKGSCGQKFWYWLIYRKHNLSVFISIISLILSIVSLLISKFFT